MDGGRPREYGFYANVDPEVAHPAGRSPVNVASVNRSPGHAMFNGYAEEVAHLYDGLDLRPISNARGRGLSRREWLWLLANVLALALLGPLTWKWLTGTDQPQPD